ncbi:MAG: DUF3352 domain-containing protein [Nocardioides sp.]
MSDSFPPSSGDSQPEFLGAPVAPESAGRSPRRTAVLAAGAAGVVLAAVAGTWGVAQLMAGGTSPASAVPSIAVAYASIDLDPSASQKIEALRMLKKFPAIDKELDLGVRDDLRRWVFEQIQDQDVCPGLNYDKDVEPWLGDRMAVAAVPDDDAPLAPLLVVQVSDRDTAALGVAALQECGDPRSGDGEATKPAGVAFAGDYMLVTEEQDDADALAKAAEAAPLQDDPAFSDWMDRIGDPGVITAYAAPEAPRLMAEMGKHQAQKMMDNGAGMDPMDALGADLPFGRFGDASRTLWRDFGGMAGVVRFNDGSMEAEVAAKGLPAGVGSSETATGPALGDLPDTTAAAFTVSLPDGWLQGYLDLLEGVLGGDEPNGFWGEVEADTGLQLPEDIEALLGDGVSLSIDASADFESAFESPDMPDLPVALRISGDPKEVTRVLDIIKAQLGPDGDLLVVEQSDDLVVIGLQQAYVDSLLDEGTLRDLDAFQDVVPEAGRAAGALFVNFDAGDGWLDALADGDKEAAANLAPLDALGMSSWREGDVQHGLVRLTTD